MEPFVTPPSRAGLDLLSDTPYEPGSPLYTERQVATRLLFAGESEGYHAGVHFDDARTAAIFDATPASFRALFLSEWLEWYSAQLRTDENWRTLLTALHVSSIAEQGGIVGEFEQQMRDNVRGRLILQGGEGVEERIFEVFADYRRYAHECAKVYAGLDATDDRSRLRDAFVDALSSARVRAADAWQAAARRISTDYGVIHPWQTKKYRDDDLMLDSRDEQEPLIAYFDFYAEGLRCKADGLVSRIQAAMPSVDQAFEWIAEKRRIAVQDPAHARHDMLMRDVGLHLPVDLDLRLSLIERHARQCASLGVAWWVEAEESYLARKDQWESFLEKLPWLSGIVNGVGDLLAGFTETYVNLYAHTPETAQAAVRLCLRYERWIKSGVVDDIVLPKVAAHWSYRTSGSTVSLQLKVGARTLYAGDYTVLEAADAQRGRFTGPTGTVKEVSYRKMQEVELSAKIKRLPPISILDPEALERLEGKAGIVSTMGALLDVALATRELTNSSAQGFELFTSEPAQVATWSALQGCEAVSELVSMARKARGLGALSTGAVAWASRAGAAGVVLEGAASLREGHKVLYAQDGDLIAALDRGEETRSLLELTRGVSLMAMGAGGVVGGTAAGLATYGSFGALSVVAGPFLMLFGVGSIAVAVACVAIYIHSGSENRVKPLIESIAKAEQSEFHLDARGRETTRERQAVRLRQRIGVLNKLAHHALASLQA
jgi:hypothetical protein